MTVNDRGDLENRVQAMERKLDTIIDLQRQLMEKMERLEGRSPRKRKRIVTENDDEEEPFTFAPEQIIKLKYRSNSVKHFAKEIAVKIYTEKERKESNCTGSKGKKLLSPRRMKAIKECVFTQFSVAEGQREDVWAHCRNAINEAGRRR